VESYIYTVNEGQRYINLNPGRLFVQQPPQKGKGSRGSFKLLHLRLQQGKTAITPQDKNESNTTKTKNTYNKINTYKKLKPGLVASYDIRADSAWKQSGTILVEWDGTEQQENR